MKIIEGWNNYPSDGPPTAVTIGNFDGVHLGHRTIIDRLIAAASQQRVSPTVITFDPHPRQVLMGEVPPQLCSAEERNRLLAEAGIAQMVVIEFNEELQHTEPETFLKDVLVDGLRAKVIVVGESFRFGHMARGDVLMLGSLSSDLDYSFESVQLEKLKGRRLSSTEVRHAIAEGDLAWANGALGRPYSLRGVVEKGDGRGKDLGFPTINIKPEEGIVIPKVGIYAGHVSVDEQRHDAAMSVGTKPTFGDHPVTVEAHLIDFSGDLYGKTVDAAFVAWIRDEEAFSTTGDLVSAMSADVEKARKLL